jgi:hypothetical protein
MTMRAAYTISRIIRHQRNESLKALDSGVSEVPVELIQQVVNLLQKNDQAFRVVCAGVRPESRSTNAGDTFASRRNGGACRARRLARVRKHREQQESPLSSVELGALIWARENRHTFPGQLLLWRFSQWILFSADLAAS